MSGIAALNPAEAAAERAWATLLDHLRDGSSFVFEAGAGAGKTYSLIAALKLLLKDARELGRRHQQIACITFTDVARDNIIAQTDAHPAIYCETTHAFAWGLSAPFQKRLCELVAQLPSFADKAEAIALTPLQAVDYALGRRDVQDGVALLHHDDIFPLFIHLLQGEKFRALVGSRFPVILVDEYQDTNAALIEALKDQLIGQPGAPQFGFFGDHWQKVYDKTCGSITHPALKRVEKKANFRSARPIVDCLNRLRPSLTQAPRDPSSQGSVRVFHTNGWAGKRETRNHWQQDLLPATAADAFEQVQDRLTAEGWDFDGPTKVLMLTHRALATKMGYPSLPSVFRYNDSFTRKANDLIAYFDEHLEPAAQAYLAHRYGAMFDAFDARRPVLNSPADKTVWSTMMQQLCLLRETGTVGEVLDHLAASGLPVLSDKVVKRERQLREAKASGEALPRAQEEHEKLRAVRFHEIVQLCGYLKGHSPFETKHGVKGEQFENVLVVFGRGWNEYDFNAYLEMAAQPPTAGERLEAFERYRNLFYVAVSRPKTRLALLFTQKLSPPALAQLTQWFGPNPIVDIGPGLS